MTTEEIEVKCFQNFSCAVDPLPTCPWRNTVN